MAPLHKFREMGYPCFGYIVEVNIIYSSVYSIGLDTEVLAPPLGFKSETLNLYNNNGFLVFEFKI